MRFLRSIQDIFNRKDDTKSKKVQDYLDLINNSYNLKSISDEIKDNIKRYDLSSDDINVKFKIGIYKRRPKKKPSLITLLSCSIYMGKIYFSTLTAENILLSGIESHLFYKRGFKYTQIQHRSQSYLCTQETADLASLDIYVTFNSKKDPTDIIHDSFNFLINKYKFKISNNMIEDRFKKTRIMYYKTIDMSKEISDKIYN